MCAFPLPEIPNYTRTRHVERFLIAFWVLLVPVLAHAQVGTLESGVAITDPEILVRLEQRFSIGVLLAGDATAMNDRVFKDRPLSNIVGALKKDIASLPQMSLDPTARAAFKKPDSGRYRFNSQLNNPKSRFALTGIVNRMDRAYRTVDANKRTYTCGEIRFIYRFSYLVEVPDHPDISSRLPLTMSVVLNAKNKTDSITCADIAARWLKAGRKASREELQAYLLDSGGPLDYLRPSQLDRVEVNIQLFRLPAQIKTDFGGHAEYLLRVFKRETPGASFVATFMENQIDREKLLTDRKLLGSFKQWLLSKSTIWDLDHGLLDVPWIYLATRAISVSPGGASRSQNNPYSGVGITDKEINEALKRYLESGEKLQTIKSPAGFNRRLNDLSCTGCHQTRGIAGFHFPGADLPTEHPRNAVHIPASPHFFGDVPRRRAVIAAFAANKTVDFSRGYSERPDDRFKADLSGTQLFNGWGAVCHLGDDASFLNWTCGSGLECTSLYESPLKGRPIPTTMCFPRYHRVGMITRPHIRDSRRTTIQAAFPPACCGSPVASIFRVWRRAGASPVTALMHVLRRERHFPIAWSDTP